MVSLLEGGPTLLVRAVPGGTLWAKTQPPGARLQAQTPGLAPGWGTRDAIPGDVHFLVVFLFIRGFGTDLSLTRHLGPVWILSLPQGICVKIFIIRIIFQLPGLIISQYVVRLLFVCLSVKPLGGGSIHPYCKMKNSMLSLKEILESFWNLMLALFPIQGDFGRQ